MGSQKTTPPFIFFTDFDGTITLRDSNDFLTDTLGFGQATRKALNMDVLHRGRPFRETFQAMMDSVQLPFSQCVAYLLDHVELDPHFCAFYRWCRENDVPVVVLSGGMGPVIEALLGKFLDGEEMECLRIVSNGAEAREGMGMEEEGGWRIVFRDESPFGHDKSIEIRKYSSLPEGERPTMFYAGDGVSDLSAAKETDLLFAKAGMDLVTYCENQKVPFVTFNDFSTILSTVQAIVAGKTTCEAEAKGRIL